MDEEIESNDSILLSKSIIGGLILKLNAMAKKTTVEDDLNGVLDQFINVLNESENYLSNGIINVNFSKAALLLQSSATIYAKKVDVLWETLFEYHKELVKYEKDSAKTAKEAQLIEERQNRYKRKRKIQETLLHEEKSTISKLVHAAEKVEATCFTQCQNLQQSWNNGHMNTVTNRASENCIPLIDCPFLINSAVRSEGEILTTCDKLHTSAAVQELSQDYIDFRMKCLKENFFSTSNFYEQDHVLQKFLLHKGVNIFEMEKLFTCECKNYFTNYYRQKSTMLINLSKALAEKRNALCPKNLVTRINRISQDVHQNLKKDICGDTIKRSASVMQTSYDDGKEQNTFENSDFIDELDSSFTPVEKDSCDQNKSTSEELEDQQLEDSAFVDDVGLSFESSNEIENDAADEQSPAQIENTDGALHVEELAQSSTQGENTNSMLHEEEIVHQTKRQKEKITDVNSKTKKVPKEVAVARKRKIVSSEEDEEKPLKKKRKYVRLIKLIVKATASLKKFEKFFSEHYIPEENEGTISLYDYSDSESEGDDNNCDDFTEITCTEDITVTEMNSSNLSVDLASEQNKSNEEEISSLDTELPEEQTLLNEDENLSSHVVSTVECSSSNTQTDTEQPIVKRVDVSKRIEELQNSQKRIKEWNTFIGEKLKTQENKEDFDIHQYGSKIIDAMETNETRKFGEIVQGNSASEVCRYFFAALQLANTSNLEIINPNEGSVANNSLQLKLLSKERYHDHLEDYVAPSEESFNERLARVQALNQSQQMCSTPFSKRARKDEQKLSRSRHSESMPSTSRQSDMRERYYKS